MFRFKHGVRLYSSASFSSVFAPVLSGARDLSCRRSFEGSVAALQICYATLVFLLNLSAVNCVPCEAGGSPSLSTSSPQAVH